MCLTRNAVAFVHLVVMLSAMMHAHDTSGLALPLATPEILALAGNI